MEKKLHFPDPKFLIKIVRPMKIATFLLLISIQLSAKSFGQQKISLNVQKSNIFSVLKQIETQSSYRFFYSNDVLPVNKELMVHFQDAEIEPVLNKILYGLDVKWKIMDEKNIVFPIALVLLLPIILK